MGLDMYLTREHYVKNWDFLSEDEKWTISITGPVPIDVSKVATISEDIHSWHKADVIHNWFVEHVQDGNDNGSKYWVPVERLHELAEKCRRVLEDHLLAEEYLLSPRGRSPLDEDYIRQLTETAEALADLPDGGEYFYSSSW